MHLLDGAALGGPDHQTPLCKTPVISNAADFVPGALASWQDADGTRWVLAPTAGPAPSDAGVTLNSGNVTQGANVAWTGAEQGGAAAPPHAWESADLAHSPAPTHINGGGLPA